MPNVITPRPSWLRKPPTGTPLNLVHPLSQGLIIAVPFNEGAGTLLSDVSPFASVGRFAPAMVAGWMGGPTGGAALKFDGTDDYAVFPTKPLYNINAPFTVAARITPAIVDANFHAICGHHDPTQNLGLTQESWTLYQDNAGKIGLYNQAANAFAIIGNQVLIATQTYLAVAVATGNVVQIWVNGRLDNSSAYTTSFVGTNGGVPFAVGWRNPGAPQAFNGVIDSVFWWNRALPADQITQLYQQPYGMFQRGKYVIPVTAAATRGNYFIAMAS